MRSNTCSALALSALTLCALLATRTADAQGLNNRQNIGNNIPIVLDCSPESQAKLQQLSDQGDAAAQYAMGLEALFEKCVPRDPKMAMLYLSKSASTNYPPAMHWLAALLQGDKPQNTQKIFALYRTSALLGYRRSELNVAMYYADPKSKLHSNADAYAWIKLCVDHDRFCEGIFDEFLAHLSLDDKKNGQKIQDDLFEKMRDIEPVTDPYRFLGTWREPRE